MCVYTCTNTQKKSRSSESNDENIYFKQQRKIFIKKPFSLLDNALKLMDNIKHIDQTLYNENFRSKFN